MDDQKAVYTKIAVLAIIAIVAIAAICYASAGIGAKRGESQYTGHVVDVVEDKGLIFTPSWANMKTSPRSSDIQSYCITPAREDELLSKFYAAMEDGGRYTVTYDRPLWVSPSACRSSDAIITDIRPANTTGGGA